MMKLHLCFLLHVYLLLFFFYPLDGSERLSICPWPQKSRYILKLDSICASNSHILTKNSNTNNFSRSITRTCEILALPLISDIQGSRAQGLIYVYRLASGEPSRRLLSLTLYTTRTALYPFPTCDNSYFISPTACYC